MATLQDAGRIANAIAFSQRPLYLAWGRGAAAWDATPQPEPSNATALIDEVGRRLASFVGFVAPSPSGEIELSSGHRYTASTVPTQWVYMSTVFWFNEADGETLRELAVFVGGATDPGLPPGQRYFTPGEVTDPGHMYLLERVPAFPRTLSVREMFEYVFPF